MIARKKEGSYGPDGTPYRYASLSSIKDLVKEQQFGNEWWGEGAGRELSWTVLIYAAPYVLNYKVSFVVCQQLFLLI